MYLFIIDLIPNTKITNYIINNYINFKIKKFKYFQIIKIVKK